MSDEQSTVPEPLGNDPTVRTPEGTIRDTQTSQPNPTPESPSTEAQPDATPPKPADGPPEKYDFKAPEGFTLDTKAIEAATPIFKELGLSQDSAQKLVDFYTAQMKAGVESEYAKFDAAVDGWRKDIISDTTLGNGKDGLKSEVASSIATTIDSLGPDLAGKFREAMDITGIGDHPVFVRAMYELGQRLGEGKPVNGANPSPGGQVAPGSRPRSAAQALFPNLPSSAS